MSDLPELKLGQPIVQNGTKRRIRQLVSAHGRLIVRSREHFRPHTWAELDALDLVWDKRVGVWRDAKENSR